MSGFQSFCHRFAPVGAGGAIFCFFLGRECDTSRRGRIRKWKMSASVSDTVGQGLFSTAKLRLRRIDLLGFRLWVISHAAAPRASISSRDAVALFPPDQRG